MSIFKEMYSTFKNGAILATFVDGIPSSKNWSNDDLNNLYIHLVIADIGSTFQQKSKKACIIKTIGSDIKKIGIC